jgi:aryl-alcohol dehydrogenase-like predicted oxidoreductase
VTAYVSPIQFGALSVGNKQNATSGDTDKESSFKVLDAYFDNGENYIDTANE